MKLIALLLRAWISVRKKEKPSTRKERQRSHSMSAFLFGVGVGVIGTLYSTKLSALLSQAKDAASNLCVPKPKLPTSVVESPVATRVSIRSSMLSRQSPS